MAATVAFADLGNLAGAGFPNVSEIQDQQLYLEPEISPENCFEGIVGKSSALRKVPDKSRSSRRPIPPCYFTVKQAPARS
jgi:hypothetical protein